jgi:hypothetical protein
MGQDIFRTATNQDGKSGVFEYDDDVGYFYFIENSRESGEKIVNSIFIVDETFNADAHEAKVIWNENEEAVGLYIDKILWAVFTTSGKSYGGNYQPNASPDIPSYIISLF